MPPPPPTPSEERLLHLLKTKGPLTSADLARRLAITAAAVRQHLDRLLAGGRVAFHDAKGRVGRPRRVWRLTEAAQGLFPDSHAELAVGMVESVRDAFGSRGLARLLEERTRRQVAAYRERVPPPRAPLERRVAALARIRHDEGYMAEWGRERDGSLWLVENHCPICVAARSCVGLCDGELRLFQEVLGPGARVERREHILAGARRCLYRIERVGRGGPVDRASRAGSRP